MPVVSPIQPAFSKGEISPSARARVDLDEFKYGLAFCENFLPKPQGSLLMSAGSQMVDDLAAEEPRLVPFRVSGAANDFIIALSNLKLRIYDRTTGARVSTAKNLAVNGSFDTSLDGWYDWNGAAFVPSPSGTGYVIWANETLQTRGAFRQGLVTTAGHHYRVYWRARRTPAAGAGSRLSVAVPGVAARFDNPNSSWTNFSIDFVGTGGTDYYTWDTNDYFQVDDVVVVDLDVPLVDEIVAPWTADQLAAIQYDAEGARNRVVFVHGSVQPQTLTYLTSAGAWEIKPAAFVKQPPEWGPENWPTAVEVGFQGRQWFGATPNEPHTVWGSKSGLAFDFGVSTPVVDSDSLSLIISTKDVFRWMRGQKRLILGGETVEHALSGGNSIITPSARQVEDQSAFGSAAVQGLHIGDQVVWVMRNLRTIRAMNYEFQEDAWLSRPVNLFADHIIPDGVKELHFAPDPFPVIAPVCTGGALRGCTYDRASKTLAWFRLNPGAEVISAAVANGPAGSELWIAARRAAGHNCIERIPLHETGIDYLDSWSEETPVGSLPGLGAVIDGLERFEGEIITVKQTDEDGSVALYRFPVLDGAVVLPDDLAGKTVVVGLRHAAKATTLPVEGGNPGGTSQGLSVHWSEIVVRLSNSARPLINGERASIGKAFGPSMDTLEALLTADVRVCGSTVAEGGQIDIEQDAPFRTEVCGIFGQAEVSKL